MDRVYLQQGLDKMTIHFDEEQVDRLERYLVLLQKWNKVYNLTAITQPKAMIDKHLLDSLSIYSLLEGEHFLDVGSGAGLPGIPLAIANPSWHMTVLDSASKKIRFLTQVKSELKLNNLTVVHQRLQDYQPLKPIDMVLSRAFQSIRDVIAASAHFNHEGVLLMKGQYPIEELQAVPNAYHAQIVPLTVPRLDEVRHAVIIKRNVV